MSKKKHKISAKEWNEKYPIGTKVDYDSVLPPIGPAIRSETRSEAWELGDGSPVVLLRGSVGGKHLSHLRVVQDAETG